MWGRHYLRAYAQHPYCEIVALVDQAKDRRAEAAAHYGIDTALDSLDDLLERDKPDIISVALPVALNRESVIACAEAGISVVSCEKPIAVSLEDADEMVRVCEERGTLFSCGTAPLEISHLPETVAWIQEGNIGKLTAAAIPGGLPVEISGAGCVQLAQLQIATGMSIDWVEGWTLPSVGNYAAAEASQLESDCPDTDAWGCPAASFVMSRDPARVSRAGYPLPAKTGRSGWVELNPSLYRDQEPKRLRYTRSG